MLPTSRWPQSAWSCSSSQSFSWPGGKKIMNVARAVAITLIMAGIFFCGVSGCGDNEPEAQTCAVTIDDTAVCFFGYPKCQEIHTSLDCRVSDAVSGLPFERCYSASGTDVGPCLNMSGNIPVALCERVCPNDVQGIRSYQTPLPRRWQTRARYRRGFTRTEGLRGSQAGVSPGRLGNAT